MKKSWPVFLISILAMGCSNKAVYDNMQRNNRLECASVPSSQYDECMERSGKSYEDYNRDREAVLEAD